MDKLFKLRAKHKEICDKADAILNPEDGHEITEDEQAKFDELMESAEKVQQQIVNEEKLIDQKRTVPAQSTDTTISNVHDRREDDPTCGFSNLGEFATVVHAAGQGGVRPDERLLVSAAASGANTQTGSEGGFAIPPQFSTTIHEGLMADEASLLSLCDQYTVTGSSLTFSAVDGNVRSGGSRYGGVVAFWVKEGNKIKSSDYKLREMELKPQKLAVLIPATNELLSQAVAADQFISRAATSALKAKVNDAILNGNGTGKPHGIMNSGCLLGIDAESSQSKQTIVAPNINKMWARMPAECRNRSIWLHNHGCSEQFDGLNVISTDNAGSKTVVGLSSGIYNSGKETLKGRPMLTTEYCKELGTKGDIVLVDPSFYAVGLRGGVKSAMSIHLRFDYDESVFRFTFELDGQSWLNGVIIPENGPELSPMIALNNRK